MRRPSSFTSCFIVGSCCYGRTVPRRAKELWKSKVDLSLKICAGFGRPPRAKRGENGAPGGPSAKSEPMRIPAVQTGTVLACTKPGHWRGGSGGGSGQSAGRGGTGGGRYLPPGAAAGAACWAFFCAGKDSVLILKDKKVLFPERFPSSVPAAAVFTGGVGSKFFGF
jgi:hypothetical protein